jgi:hypothetical protein
MKWFKENLLKILILTFIVLVVVFVLDRFFKDSTLKEDLRESDDRIAELDKDNAEKEKIVEDSMAIVKKLEKRVAEKESMIALRDIEISRLHKEEAAVPEEVEALEAPSVVLRTIKHLGLDEVRLEGEEVVFTLAAGKRNLVLLDQAVIVRQREIKLSESLADSQGALHLQKVATWHLYRVAWAQFWQILNWKGKYKEKDGQFDKAMKDRKKRWLDGLWKGFVVGVIVTVILTVLRGSR